MDFTRRIFFLLEYMHNGATVYISRITREYLLQICPNSWIGQGGPQLWPSRSPDLNSSDFFWVHDVDDLRSKLIAECQIIRNISRISQWEDKLRGVLWLEVAILNNYYIGKLLVSIVFAVFVPLCLINHKTFSLLFNNCFKEVISLH